MASETDRLIVLLEARITDLERDLGKATSRIDAFAKKTKSEFAAIKSAVGPIAGALTAAFSVRSIVNFTNENIKLGDAIGKVADKVKLGTEELQKWRFASERGGVAAATFDMAAQRFRRRLEEVSEGGGEARAAIKELGVQLLDENGKFRTTNDLLLDVADAFLNNVDSSQHLRLAFKLFDSEGAAMVNVLRDGSEGVRELFREFEALGGVIQDDTIRKMEQLQDTITNTNAAITAQKVEIAQNLSPLVTAWNTAVIGVTRAYNNAVETGKEWVHTWRDVYNRSYDMYTATAEAEAGERARIAALRESKEAQDDVADSVAETVPRLQQYVDVTNQLTQRITHLNEVAQRNFEARMKRLNDQFGDMQEIPQTVTPDNDWFNDVVDHRRQAFESFTSAARSAYDQMWSSMANSDITGAQRWKAIQNSMLQAGLRMVGDLLIAWIAAEGKKQATSAATRASVVADALAEVTAKLRSAAASIASAVADAIKWTVATLGPFAIFAAGGAAAAVIGLWSKLKSSLGFEKGGILPKGKMGFFEGAGNEVVAPQQDFLRVMESLLGMRRQDFGREAAGVGGGSMTFNIQTLDPRALTQVIRKDVIPILREERKRGRNW